MRSLLALVTFVLSTSAAAACTVTVTPVDVSRLSSILGQANQVVCFAPGTYRLSGGTYDLGAGTTARCTTRRQCIINGRSRTAKGFATTYGATVPSTISGFVFRNFTSTCVQSRAGGIVDDVEATACEIGAEVDGTIRNSWLHHNRRYGLTGGPAQGILIEGNEISYNNTSRFNLDDAGGTKVGSSQGVSVTWRNNRVHHNFGHGIWNDGRVTGLVEGNTVYDNEYFGIEHEISWDLTVRNNMVYGNNYVTRGLGKSCWHGAQINVTQSRNVSIYSNTITAHDVNAICVTSNVRPLPSIYPQNSGNISVTNNSITMSLGAHIGYVSGIPGESDSNMGISFNNNAYTLSDQGAAHWQSPSNGAFKTWTQWQAIGQDAGSTVK